MTKLSVEDLKQIKNKTLVGMALRQTTPSVQVTIHMGDCGLAAGARDLVKVFMNAMGQANRQDIRLLVADCADAEKCGNEPKITVVSGSEAPVVYQDVTPEKAQEIFTGHILGGTVLTDYVAK